jgi:hypothetical protein
MLAHIESIGVVKEAHIRLSVRLAPPRGLVGHKIQTIVPSQGAAQHLAV